MIIAILGSAHLLLGGYLIISQAMAAKAMDKALNKAAKAILARKAVRASMIAKRYAVTQHQPIPASVFSGYLENTFLRR